MSVPVLYDLKSVHEKAGALQEQENAGFSFF